MTVTEIRLTFHQDIGLRAPTNDGVYPGHVPKYAGRLEYIKWLENLIVNLTTNVELSKEKEKETP